ncbi:prevent-host-death family protein [Kaistia hirudinis]|uniref:Antitoxin n=1 Tax=Kaistia hirudinis TaxID=1293440 RepID=A0A840AQ36_9HYPH|nr:type II toxin-antitoxin system prevent-host-death family antitoxin [Kaistia hirudinis]MBB3932389.1 prevent-host-death family protein [Kaistia hirudinis]
MRISLAEAETQLGELVRRAEAGDEIVLTRDGKPSVRLVPVELPALTEEQIAARRRLMEGIWETAKAKALAGPSAARSQDYLYDENGLPG